MQAAARICRFCGYAFDREFAAANPSFVRLSGNPPRPRIFTRRWFFFRVLLPLLFIGLILLYVVSQLASQLHYLTPDNPHPTIATPLVLVLDSYPE